MVVTRDQRRVRQWKRYHDLHKINHRWINEIPSHWSKKRISYLFDLLGSGTTPNTSERRFYEDARIPWVNTGDLNDGTVTVTEKCVNETAIREHSALKLYPAGTLLIALYGATIGKLGLLSTASTVNQACFAMGAPKNDVSPRYVLYWLFGNREHIVSMAYGGGQPNISGELIRSLRITVPPLPEQRAIATFLDRETARIDALIARKKRLIELLEEKRQALISHLVTKGLTRNVNRRESGIPWLGSIPSHWDIRPIKHCVNVIGGMTPSKENPEYWNGDVPWVSPKDMKRFEIFDSEDHITKAALQGTTIALLPTQTVMIVIRGMILARYVPVAINEVPVTINQDMKGLVCRPGILPRYLGYQLRSIQDAFFAVMEEAGHGTLCLRTELWNNIQIAIPNISEQEAICSEIDRGSAKIIECVSQIETSLSHLHEYRTSIISAAVTGQIDVREEVEIDG